MGTLGWLNLLLDVVLVAAACLFLLVRARRRRALHAENAYLALVAQQTSNLVVLTDRSRRITWVNPAFERVSGYTLAEVRGQSPGTLLQCGQTDPAMVARMRERLDAGRDFAGEVLNRARDGRLYWLDLHIEPLHDIRGELTGFVAIETDITERKLADHALRASQEILERTGRIGGIGGWSWEPAGNRLDWTPQVWRLLGVAPQAQPTLGDVLRHLGPQTRAEVLALAAEGPETREHWDLDVQVQRADGREGWLRVVGEREHADDGSWRVVGTVQDVTARRAAKAEALRSSAVLRGAIDSIDEAFVLFDADDRLVMCNEKSRAVLGPAAGVLQPGARFEDILRAGAASGHFPAAVGRVEEWVATRLQQHRSGGTPVVQHLSDGRVLRNIDRVTPDGHVVGFRVDITDLVRATEAAEQADRAKGEFIATISHELRTPLQSILGFSDLGRHFAAGHPQFETMFQDIHAGGTRMLHLVNGLLDVSKIDLTQGALALRRTDLVVLAGAVADELRLQAAARGVTMALPDPLPPVEADVDAFRIQQVLRNVLANAIRVAPADSTVQVTAEDRGAAGVVLSVLDRGPGIPPDELETIFQPFVQSSRTKSGAGGTGLGLAISQRIVAAHRGRIAAGNRAEGGACFTIELPAATSASAPAAEPAAEEPPRPRKSLRALRRTETPASV